MAVPFGDVGVQGPVQGLFTAARGEMLGPGCHAGGAVPMLNGSRPSVGRTGRTNSDEVGPVDD